MGGLPDWGFPDPQLTPSLRAGSESTDRLNAQSKSRPSSAIDLLRSLVSDVLVVLPPR
jgi:hypothetical protein